jgi:hypothetical protein
VSSCERRASVTARRGLLRSVQLQELVALSLDQKLRAQVLITRSLEGVLARRSMQTCALVTLSRNNVTFNHEHVFATQPARRLRLERNKETGRDGKRE